MSLSLSHSVHRPQRWRTAGALACSRRRGQASEEVGCQRPHLWRCGCWWGGGWWLSEWEKAQGELLWWPWGRWASWSWGWAPGSQPHLGWERRTELECNLQTRKEQQRSQLPLEVHLKSETSATAVSWKLTVLVHRQHTGSFPQQLLDDHCQSLSCCYVQRPAGGWREMKC